LEDKSEIRKTVDLLFSARMLKFFPLMLWGGAISLAMYSALFVPLFTLGMDGFSEEDKIKYSTLAMVGAGFGQVIGGFTNGYLQDKLPTKTVIYINLIELVVAVAALLLYTFVNKWNLWYAAGMAFLWGFMDSGVNNFCFCICGFEFDSKTLPFSIFYFAQAFGCFLFVYLESIITD
jgi:predicted MFS family arabinose efflux permease